MLALVMTASPLGLASRGFSSVGCEGASSHCERSSDESHIESIMCNKLLRKSSYFTPIPIPFPIKSNFARIEGCTWRIQDE